MVQNYFTTSIHATDDKFKENMKSYLNEVGYAHYVGTNTNRHTTLLQHLRYLARCKIARLKEVKVDGKVYGINYLSFDSKGWRVQLMAPNKEGFVDLAKTYKHLLKTYKVAYPVRKTSDVHTDTKEIEIGDHARVEQCFYVEKDGFVFKFESNNVKKTARLFTCL